MHSNKDSKAQLEKLGKHKTSGVTSGCLYINKPIDVDQGVFEVLIEKSFQYMKKMNNVK